MVRCARDTRVTGRAVSGFALCAISLVATGCTSFVPLSIDPTSGAAALEARSLESAELRRFIASAPAGSPDPWPLRAWDFETLTLAALFYSPELDVARAQWGMATAAETTAAARPNPSIGLTPERAMHTMGTPSPWIATVSLDIPIETAGKRGYRIAKAEALSQAARQALGTAAWKVRSRLRASLLEREAALQRQALQRERLALQQMAGELYDQRVASGAASRGDAAPIQLALHRTRVDVGQSQADAAQATAAVAAAIGIPAAALAGVVIHVALDAPAAPGLSIAEVRRRAMEQRADVLASLAAFAASQSALQLEIARQYPDVHLGTGYQYDQGNQKWSIGLTANIPIFDRNQGPIAEAEAARREAAARFLATQAAALAEVDEAFAAVAGAQARLEAAGSTLAATDRQAVRVERALAVGAADRLDVVIARLDSIEAAAAQVGARLALANAYGKVEDAIQSPLGVSPEVEPVRTAATTETPGTEMQP